MTSVLVTGASGFVGTRLVARLKAEGQEVTPLVRAERPHVSTEAIGADLARADHLDAIAGSGLHFDTVVHLAGRVEIALVPGSHPGAEPRPGLVADLGRLYADNVLATARLVELCERTGVTHLVFASSQAVYGMPKGDEAFVETSPCRPLEHYASSKLACELLLEVAARRALAVTVLRFPGVFSEDRPQGVVRRFCESGITDGLIVSSSAFPLPLDVLHVDDLVEAIGRCLAVPARGFRRLNIATGAPCSLDLLANDVAALIPGCQVKHDGVAQPVVRLDSTKAKRELGWQARPQRDRLSQIIASVTR